MIRFSEWLENRVNEDTEEEFDYKNLTTVLPKHELDPLPKKKKGNAQCARCGNIQSASIYNMNAGKAKCKLCGGFLHPRN